MIPAPRFEVPTVAMLVLADRDDADTFQTEWARLGNAFAATVVSLTPDIEDIKDMLSTTPDWALFGGHFDDELFNDYPGDVEPRIVLNFLPEYVLLEYRDQETQLRRDRAFMLHRRLKVSLWRGCSVFREAKFENNPNNLRILEAPSIDRIRRMRSLFGPHLMLGFNRKMGWEITQLAFGGTVTWRGVQSRVERGFLKLIEGRVNDVDTVLKAWLTCTAPILNKNGVHENYTRFCAVDPEGYYWTNDRLTGEIIRVTRV